VRPSNRFAQQRVAGQDALPKLIAVTHRAGPRPKRRARRMLLLTPMIATTGFALSTGVAGAGPFCYETGPGYEKCLTSPSGDYFNPIYQGPKLDRPYIPSLYSVVSDL